ncbi:MAG: hypothetical protein WC586_10350 [Methanoregula sp.]
MPKRIGFFYFIITLALILVAGCAGQAPPAPSSPAPAGTSAHPTMGVLTTTPTMVPATVTTTPRITTTQPAMTVTIPASISEAALKARIQDAKNKLDMLKNSDMADTILKKARSPGECEVKISKELGYLIDSDTGEMSFIKGDYGSISLDRFRQNMTKGHTYVILHSHAKDWIYCQDTGTIGLNTFSLSDLSAPSNLTRQGFHVQKLVAVSDKMYEVYPKIPDNWKTKEEVYNTFDRIEQRLESKFHYDYYNSQGRKTTWYDVDMIMPLLTKELGYTYIADNTIIP